MSRMSSQPQRCEGSSVMLRAQNSRAMQLQPDLCHCFNLIATGTFSNSSDSAGMLWPAVPVA